MRRINRGPQLPTREAAIYPRKGRLGSRFPRQFAPCRRLWMKRHARLSGAPEPEAVMVRSTCISSKGDTQWRRLLKKTVAVVAAAMCCSDLFSAPACLRSAWSDFSCGTITRAAALPRLSSSPARASKEAVMGDRIIITKDEPKPAPDVVVVTQEDKPKVEKVVTEKTTVVETREE